MTFADFMCQIYWAGIFSFYWNRIYWNWNAVAMANSSFPSIYQRVCVCVCVCVCVSLGHVAINSVGAANREFGSFGETGILLLVIPRSTLAWSVDD